MSTIHEIESAIVSLTPAEQRAIRDWLDDLVEEQIEVSVAFVAKIERGRREIAAGEISRIRTPGEVQPSNRLLRFIHGNSTRTF